MEDEVFSNITLKTSYYFILFLKTKKKQIGSEFEQILNVWNIKFINLVFCLKQYWVLAKL